MALDVETGCRLILKAMEKERDERLFQQWTAQLPVMAMFESPVGFEEYRDRMTGANIDLRSTSEILRELDEVERQFTEGGTVNGS